MTKHACVLLMTLLLKEKQGFGVVVDHLTFYHFLLNFKVIKDDEKELNGY